jgi:hypothetical protein
VGPDGTVYATMGGLDRLAPGSDQWQSLGRLPQGQFGTAELPGAGIFWLGGGAGMLWVGPGDYYPNADPQGRVVTTSYA